MRAKLFGYTNMWRFEFGVHIIHTYHITVSKIFLYVKNNFYIGTWEMNLM